MRISNLSNKSGNPSSSDYLVLDDGTTVTKIDYNKLAKAIIENYAASTLAGSAQSVKAALDSLNSNAIHKNTTGTGAIYANVTTDYIVLAAQLSNGSMTQLAFYSSGKVALLRKRSNGSWAPEVVLREAD